MVNRSSKQKIISIGVLLLISGIAGVYIIATQDTVPEQGQVDLVAVDPSDTSGLGTGFGAYGVDPNARFLSEVGITVVSEGDVDGAVSTETYPAMLAAISRVIAQEDLNVADQIAEYDTLARMCYVNAVSACIDDLLIVYKENGLDTIDILNYKSFLDGFNQNDT